VNVCERGYRDRKPIENLHKNLTLKKAIATWMMPQQPQYNSTSAFTKRANSMDGDY